MEKLVIASDHGGFDFKSILLNHSSTFNNFEFIDLGVHSPASVDYSDFARQVCEKILNGEASRGILICGSGQGMAIQANRFKGIRAALCWNEESAKLSRAHNNANVLCLGGRLLKPDDALKIIQVWLSTPFEGGRHQSRIDKIDK